MKITRKSFLACASVLFFGVAIGMFALSFIDAKNIALIKESVSSLANGFEIAFGQTNLESAQTLGTLFAFIFVVVGVLAAIYGVIFAYTHQSGKKNNKVAKLICACSTFVVCGLVPALLLFLTLQTTDSAVAASIGGFVGGNTQLGIGAF